MKLTPFGWVTLGQRSTLHTAPSLLTYNLRSRLLVDSQCSKPRHFVCLASGKGSSKGAGLGTPGHRPCTEHSSRSIGQKPFRNRRGLTGDSGPAPGSSSWRRKKQQAGQPTSPRSADKKFPQLPSKLRQAALGCAALAAVLVAALTLPVRKVQHRSWVRQPPTHARTSSAAFLGQDANLARPVQRTSTACLSQGSSRPALLAPPNPCAMHFSARARGALFASTTVTSSISSSAAATAVPGGVRHPLAREIITLKLTLLVQQILAAHVTVKIMAVLLAAAPIVYAGGCIYSMITGSSIQLGLLKVYSVIIRVPGAKVTEEKSLAAGLLMNFFFLVGVFSFAVLIGIVSEEIKTQVKGVRSGNYPVVTSDHTLILNWNRQSIALLRKIAENSHGSASALGRELVVLAEHCKDNMDGEIAASQKITKSKLKVLTREGAPHCIRDLEAVSAATAKAVILLQPENAQDAETKQAATILGLDAARSYPSVSPGPQKIILQNPERPVEGSGEQEERSSGNTLMTLVQKSCRGRDMKLVEVNGNSNIARLIAQSAVQPGVASIYSSIAESTQGAPDFHLHRCGEELQGRSFLEARRSFSDAVVCGYISQSDRQTRLNPPDTTQLEAGDRLILLAHSGELRPRPAASNYPAVPAKKQLTQQMQAAVHRPPQPKKVVVLGWRGEVATLAGALEHFAAPGSEVVFVSRWGYPDIPPSSKRCRFTYLEGSPFDHEVCRKAGVGTCSSIIIGTVECDDGKAADARMMASLMVVQDLVSSSPPTHSSPPHVVAAIHRMGTVKMARHILELGRGRTITAELLTPNELVSGMLLQVAIEPELAPALSELVDNTSGQEIYLRRPEGYSLDDSRAVPFAEVAELARLRGETALGYVSAEGTLMLAPAAADQHLYAKGSKVVVMARGGPGAS